MSKKIASYGMAKGGLIAPTEPKNIFSLAATAIKNYGGTAPSTSAARGAIVTASIFDGVISNTKIKYSSYPARPSRGSLVSRSTLTYLAQICSDHEDNQGPCLSCSKTCYTACKEGCYTGCNTPSCVSCSGCSGCFAAGWCSCKGCSGCGDCSHACDNACTGGCQNCCRTGCSQTCFTACTSSCKSGCSNSDRSGTLASSW